MSGVRLVERALRCLRVPPPLPLWTSRHSPLMGLGLSRQRPLARMLTPSPGFILSVEVLGVARVDDLHLLLEVEVEALGPVERLMRLQRPVCRVLALSPWAPEGLAHLLGL
jgi:hypothetical protein